MIHIHYAVATAKEGRLSTVQNKSTDLPTNLDLPTGEDGEKYL